MKAIHYINQFFGQIGGEEQAGISPRFSEKLIGCSNILQNLLPEVEITHTIICGDNYANEHTEAALKEIFDFLDKQEFDMFFAGPAFLAGRYGTASGLICKAVSERYNVPVITSMNEENPGAEMYRKHAYIFKGGRKATYMREDVKAMTAFARKIVNGEELRPAAEEGYFGRGIRHQYFVKDGKNAAERMLDMMLKRLNGEEFVTELPIPTRDNISIAAPLKDLSKARIAFVSSSGIVPMGNPDHIQSASATIWGGYDISALDTLKSGEFYTVHAGYDSAPANADPNRLFPLDAFRAFENEGVIGSLSPNYYVTVGTGTTQKEAARMASEIVGRLKEDKVDAVILTST